MSQKSSGNSSSSQRVPPNEIVDWSKLLESIPMEPLEREIYEEHMKAMKEFRVQKPVDPKSIPQTKRRVIEDEECSLDDDDDDDIKMTEDEKYEGLKQREQARRDFEEDEDFHAAQFRKYRDWETRKRLALENIEQPIDLATEVMELLMYGTPIQFINKVPDPEIPNLELTGVLSIYLTPECIARDQLFVDNETPLSLSMDITPMGRNVFEIVSGDENMEGFPITYKSVVYIKVHYNEDNRDFFLSVDISSPYTVGKLYLQDSIDDLCQFQLLSVKKSNNMNQELVDLNSPVLIKHVKTGFYVMSKANITVMNICGEEKFVVGSDEIENNNVLWKLVYGSFDEDLEFDFDSFVTERWWQPQMPTTDYAQPSTSSIKDPFFCSKPSTSRDNYEPPYIKHQMRHNDPESYNAQWVEVQPGLHKSLGPPGSANEYMEDPEELFAQVKKQQLGRTKKESQQLVIDYLNKVRDHNSTPPRCNKPLEEPSTLPKANKSCLENTEPIVDFMKKLYFKSEQNNNNELVRDNKFSKESFNWPKAPEIGSPNSKPVLDNPEKIIDAIRKINLENAKMAPEQELQDEQLKDLFVWPIIPDLNTSNTTFDIIKKLEAEMLERKESEERVPTKLSEDHENEEGETKPDNFASSDLTVKHLDANEFQKIDDKITFLKNTLFLNDDTENKENVQMPDGFWDFFDSDNTHLMHSQNNSDVDLNNSTVDCGEKCEADMELEEIEIGATGISRIEEGQGDMHPQLEDSNKNRK